MNQNLNYSRENELYDARVCLKAFIEEYQTTKNFDAVMEMVDRYGFTLCLDNRVNNEKTRNSLPF